MVMNDGLIGYPSGNGLVDGASQAVYCTVARTDPGAANIYVSMPVALDTLSLGTKFRFIPNVTNDGPVNIWLNGLGPFPMVKVAPVGNFLMAPGDVLQNRTVECVLRANTENWDNWLVEMTNPIGSRAPGYEISPQGLLRQWGTSVVTTDGAGNAVITFPTPYANAGHVVVASNGDSGAVPNSWVSLYIQPPWPLAVGFAVHVQGPSAPVAFSSYRVNWHAVGAAP